MLLGAESTCVARVRCAVVAVAGLLVPACGYEHSDTTLKLEPCTDAEPRDCGSEIGECKVGQQECIDGAWGPCKGGVTPTVEECNKRDDDCDGQRDNGFAVGVPCDLPLGCPGRTVCSEDGAATTCERDPTRMTEEVCDGVDNDCDGRIDYVAGTSLFVSVCDLEPCADEEPLDCGSDIGECKVGQQECTDGAWGPCKGGVTPTVEECNKRDDDCDGQRDNGFAVGVPCDLPLGCPGRSVCSEDGVATTCEPDPTRMTEEICDGVDNDCDGRVDYVVGTSRLVSVCDCVKERLSFGSSPTNGSITDDVADDPPDGGFLCGTTTCEPTQPTRDALEMSFCVNCSETHTDGYALCVGATTVDLKSFARGSGDEVALTARFTFESDRPAAADANLYYEVPAPGDASTGGARRHFRLLAAGDPPGTYTRSFLAIHTCFGKPEGIDCEGTLESCADCREGDTCGDEAGEDCADLPLTNARLQLAIEDCSGSRSAEGTIRIHEVFLGPPGCEPETPRP